MEGLWGNVKINYDAYFYINDDAKMFRYLSVTKNFTFIIHYSVLFCSKYYDSPWIH